MPTRTCARIVSKRGTPRLADVDRVTGEVRRRGPAAPVGYEWERIGEFLHVDVKKVVRLHVAVDGFSRVAYAELPPDERRGTRAAFMGRCSARLHGALQLVAPAQRVRGPAAHVAHRGRKQPIGTQQLGVGATPHVVEVIAEFHAVRAVRAHEAMRR